MTPPLVLNITKKHLGPLRVKSQDHILCLPRNQVHRKVEILRKRLTSTVNPDNVENMKLVTAYSGANLISSQDP